MPSGYRLRDLPQSDLPGIVARSPPFPAFFPVTICPPFLETVFPIIIFIDLSGSLRVSAAFRLRVLFWFRHRIVYSPDIMRHTCLLAVRPFADFLHGNIAHFAGNVIKYTAVIREDAEVTFLNSCAKVLSFGYFSSAWEGLLVLFPRKRTPVPPPESRIRICLP